MTMTDGKETKLAGSKMSKRLALMVATTAVLVPAFAFAVETDRLTVEDPTSGAVMFRVTSAGNVTGNAFVGDGAGLTNVPHWKGAWSSATTYNKDETVSYSGGSYIALKQSVAVQPNTDATSWAVFAQKGADGAQGAAGAQGSQGPQGPQGPIGQTGPAGSPDGQVEILTKIGTKADGAVLSVQQGPTEGVSAVKFAIKDSAGTRKIALSPAALVLGSPSLSAPIAVDSALNPDIAGSPSIVISGDGNKERFELRSSVQIAFVGRVSGGTMASPAATPSGKTLFTLAAGGHDGTGWITANNPAVINMQAEEAFTPTANGTRITFGTTPMGAPALQRAERMRITSAGYVGIGTTAPTQKLEVAGGVKVASSGTKPTCDDSTRGTFWFSNGGAADDTMEVCAKAGGTNAWKKVSWQ